MGVWYVEIIQGLAVLRRLLWGQGLGLKIWSLRGLGFVV